MSNQVAYIFQSNCTHMLKIEFEIESGFKISKAHVFVQKFGQFSVSDLKLFWLIAALSIVHIYRLDIQIKYKDESTTISPCPEKGVRISNAIRY